MSDSIDRQAAIDQLHQSYNLLDAERRLEDMPPAQPEPYEDKLKRIADALSEKMCYMNTCPNERDIILGYLGRKRSSKKHCDTDCWNEKCESYHCETKQQPERKRAKWIHGREVSREMIGDAVTAIFYEGWECSECHALVEDEREPLWKFCPNYGNTQSGKRDMKSQQSNFEEGLERTVKVYDIEGDLIQEYSGKFDVDYDVARIIFDDDNGKRHVIYYSTATVIIDEK